MIYNEILLRHWISKSRKKAGENKRWKRKGRWAKGKFCATRVSIFSPPNILALSVLLWLKNRFLCPSCCLQIFIDASMCNCIVQDYFKGKSVFLSVIVADLYRDDALIRIEKINFIHTSKRFFFRIWSVSVFSMIHNTDYSYVMQ